MGYYGNQPSVGEHNDTFKKLDDISSYTLTFDGSSSAVVSAGNDTITSNSHRFVQGQRVTYTNGSGGNIGGLTTGTAYFVIKHDQNNIKLATNASNAAAGTAINLTAVGSGTSHTLNVAFDGTILSLQQRMIVEAKQRLQRLDNFRFLLMVLFSNQ